MVGADGDLACFSFGPVKVITSLEGGAVVTPRAEDVQTLHELRLIGVDSDTDARYKNSRTWEYDVVRQGSVATSGQFRPRWASRNWR
jgi:dTDP-4-amino-4,6-dideoxygalactose transaminase